MVQRAFDGAADATLEFVVGRAFKGGVGGDAGTLLVMRFVLALCLLLMLRFLLLMLCFLLESRVLRVMSFRCLVLLSLLALPGFAIRLDWRL